MRHCRALIQPTLVVLILASRLVAQDPSAIVIPHHQQAPPGPPLSPQEALAKMEVPAGFSVELVASEPDVVNPVAMTIDERGRFWITESFEYPRRSPGPGRDRIKILEDTDHDGTVDKVTVFAEGLNIPSGIAVGYGGVWVANAPDILYLRDTDGDDRADHSEVVVTGFGRTDTHELPNSLTWGPDGWLYGLNGVFNHSHVTHQGRDVEFTCALFRIHPRTREFQLFAEGTSNPWGIAFDNEGSAFVSACVIDHLWHLTESGYYHRQGGPYPPHTWKLGSIVQHKHQMAAYCGITYFDSDAYPPEYRERLYMGNIHGGCINVDYLSRRGATYFAKPASDFLTANDVWFMPVVQKTGPDGCLYVLDWYDRYHCYQDANRDPEGIDRGRGRLYRVRYQNTPRAEPFDLSCETDDQLIARLQSPNVFYRDLAQRLLSERASGMLRSRLRDVVLDDQLSRKARMHALWALIGGGPLDADFHLTLTQHHDPIVRSWAVRAAGNQGDVPDRLAHRVVELADDDSPDVRLQVAIAARKLPQLDTLHVLCRVLQHPQPDPLIPHIVWQNLLPLLETQSDSLVRLTRALDEPSDGFARLMPRLIQWLLDRPDSADDLAQVVVTVLADTRWSSRSECLQVVREGLMKQRHWRSQLDGFRSSLLPALQSEINRSPSTVRKDCQLLAALLGDAAATHSLREWLELDRDVKPIDRLAAFQVLAANADDQIIDAAERIIAAAETLEPELVTGIVGALGQLDRQDIAHRLLNHLESLPDGLQPRIIDQLTQRNDWAKQLLQAIHNAQLSRDVLHINQVRRLQASSDPELAAYVHQIWGKIREGRNPQVEEAIASVRRLVEELPGNAQRGMDVFHKHCGQCHQIYGRGEQVGPDITSNGRASFEQLLSNVFDPNLVIGSAYQAHVVNTTDGRSLSGLLVLETDSQIVLRLQGGKEEMIRREEIEELTVSPLSLMPEGWEKQLTPQELVDLMQFITLDGPPDDPNAKRLPGTPPLK